MKKMNWNDIQYFLALVDGGNLSAGARSLSVEHSTIARRIEQLEQQLGIRLFDRMQRGWQLTKEGKDLLNASRQMAEGAQRIQRIANASTTLSGSVRVSVPPLIGYHLITPFIPRLRTKLPSIEVELVSDLQNADLHRREADIALRMRRPDHPNLVARRIASLPYALYASKEYLENTPPDQWQFVGYEKSMQATPQQQWLDSQLNNRTVSFRSNDLHVLAMAIEQNVGVGVLPSFLEGSYSRIEKIDTPSCPVVRDLWLVIHPDLRRSPRVRAIADEIIQWFEFNQWS